MKNRRFALVASVLASAIGAGLTGCTGASRTSASYLRSHLTPELSTLAWRHDEVYNDLALTRNQQLRALNEDLGRVLLYVDRPTRLTPAPVAH